MKSLPSLLAVFLMIAAATWAQTPPVVQITGITPDSANQVAARELSAAKQKNAAAAAQAPAPSSSFLGKIGTTLSVALVPLCFLGVPAYPLLQFFALWKLRGPARLLSALPLSFMLPVYAFSLFALSQGSSLWPLYAVFASPVAFVITLAVVTIARRQSRRAAA
jgi:hypothetical protein